MSDGIRSINDAVASSPARRQRRARAMTPSRLASSLLATVPIVLAGSLAISLATPAAADAAPTQPKSSKSPLKAVKLKAASSTTTAPSTYRVQPGDTVSSISGRYGLSTASVLTLNGLGWKSLIYPGQVLRLAKAAPTSDRATTASTVGHRYTIRSGDTVTAIARRFTVTVASVLKANGLTASSIIYPGAKLTIPAAATTIDAQPAASVTPTATTSRVTHYTIATGDTITSIAAKFGVPVSTVLSSNGMSSSSIIYPGQKIVMPATSAYVPGYGMVTLLNSETSKNARTIISVGRSLGVNDKGIVIALATAMQESAMRNLDYGHLDSIGLFQQRPSIGWGTRAQLLDTTYATRAFFGGSSGPTAGITRGLLDVPGWESMSVTRAAQAVQVSAHPNAYAQWERSARYWLAELG